MNTFQVLIGGQRINNVSLPFKYGNFLDQQLDFATLTLTRINIKNYPPCTPVIVTVYSENTANGVTYSQSKRFEYIVQGDNSRESPVGSGFYRHEITLIEPTKLLEIPLESLCFTNVGLKEYKKQTPPVNVETEEIPAHPTLPSSVVSPLYTGDTISLLPVADLIIVDFGATPNPATGGVTSKYLQVNNSYVSVTTRNGVERYSFDEVGRFTNTPSITIAEGVNTIRYYCVIDNFNGVFTTQHIVDFTYQIIGIGSVTPPDPYNVQEVIDRILRLQEPLCIIDRNTEDDVPGTIYPRFKFDLANIPEDKRALFTARNAPEFTFTRQTLREALQTIGGFIHAEPRLLYNDDTNEFDTITFDFFGDIDYAEYYDVNEKADKLLNEYNYEDITRSWNIEQACNELDSYQDNLVNRINKNIATTAQPFATGIQTMRTETVGARLEEGNMYFPTVYPISEIQKFEYIDAGTGTAYDFTPYLYEQSIYESQLSSYEDAYPTSKAYALYYKQNQPGIYGFFFKREEISGGAFAKYSIVNIINLVTGSNYNGKPFFSLGKDGDLNYAALRFRLTYTPIHSARIKHSKQYIGDWLEYPRTLNYSQGANQVETKYFGENIKGAVERLGTLEKLITFTCFNINTIPKAGLLWDEDYYIATVSVECMVNKFKVTCGLSKNFNRISQYIGVSSYKRQYEVSEVMVQKREWLWKDYLVFTDYTKTPPAAQEDCLIGSSVLRYFKNTLLQDDSVFFKSQITAVEALGADDTAYTRVVLPVIATAVGNVMEFTWEYKDNYSAGQQVVQVDNNYYAQDVQYANYFGRFLYQDFWLATPSGMVGMDPYTLPQGAISESGINIITSGTLYISKDSREALQQTMSVEYVTDTKGFVIGSGLAEYNPMVRGLSAQYYKPRLITLKKRLNKFSKYISGDDKAEIFENPSTGEPLIQDSWFTITDEGNAISFYGENNYATESAKSWAYVVPVSLSTGLFYQVLFGKNMDIVAGMKIGDFTLYALHNVYKHLKNKA